MRSLSQLSAAIKVSNAEASAAESWACQLCLRIGVPLPLPAFFQGISRLNTRTSSEPWVGGISSTYLDLHVGVSCLEIHVRSGRSVFQLGDLK